MPLRPARDGRPRGAGGGVRHLTVIEVGTVDDPRLTDYASLNVVQTRREVERRGSFFIAESELVIRELARFADRWPIRSVLVTPKRYEAMRDVLEHLDAPVFVAPMEVVREITGFHIHRGAVASAERGTPLDAGILVRDARRLVVLEGVSDHENVGSLFRSAAAFGFDAVLLDERSADPLYRRSVRVSMGHVLRVPFARVADVEVLRSAGIETWALTPGPGATPIDDLAPPRRLALLVGAEGPGLSDRWLLAADRRVRIPLAPGVDSLNVAVAAAIAMSRVAAGTG